MSEELLGDLRSAFESFEKSLGTQEAIGYLREAIDLYLDILDSENFSEKNKTVAKTFAETYWIKFVEGIADIADNPGTYDFDIYMLWFKPAFAFLEADIGEKELNQKILWALIRSAEETLTPDEKGQVWRQVSRKLETHKSGQT